MSCAPRLNAILGYSELIEGGSSADERTGRYAGKYPTGGASTCCRWSTTSWTMPGSAAAPSSWRRSPATSPGWFVTAVDMTRPTARARDVELLMAVSEDLPPITADPRRIIQVLVNLLFERGSSSPRRAGKCWCRPTGTRTAARSSRSWIPGVGIPGAALREGDDAVRPGRRRTRRPAARHRLGLPVTREIVKRHGGELEVMTTEGHGSIFVAKLPGGRGWPRTSPAGPESAGPPT